MKNQHLDKLKTLMGKYKYLFYLAILLSVVSSVISLGAYLNVYYVIESMLSAKGNLNKSVIEKMTYFGWQSVIYVSVAFMFYGLALLLSHIVAFNTVAKYRITLIDYMNELPLGYFQKRQSGKLRKLIEKNTEEVEHYIAHQLPDMAQALTTPIAFLVLIFIFDWKLSLICLIPVILGFLLLKFMMGEDSKAFLEKYQEASANMGNDVVEYVRGISVVKIFGQTAFSFKSFNHAIENYRDFTVSYALSMKKAMSGYIVCVYGIFSFLIPATIIFFNHSEQLKSLLLSYIFFVIFTPLVAFMLMRIMESSYKAMIIFHAMDHLDKKIYKAKALSMPTISIKPTRFDITFNKVSFTYEDMKQKAINKLSFTCHPNSVTAIVGPSGSGKSTIFNLITRFYDVDEGSVLVGGVDVKKMSYEDLMSNISFVFQETKLFKLSLLENIRFYKPDATKAEVERVVDQAQCREIINKMPNGLDTVFGTSGIYLSGGEIQRITIARAMLKDAPIVLLDEATAFSDAENEYKIQQALNSMMKNKTVIMIAHRLSTVTHADQILVIDEGELVEQGQHRSLMKENGVYARMYNNYQQSVNWRIGVER
ncbi:MULTISPECIES: ABC transporter ATP-binding protein [Staphylococcus]|uniref:ABC transporter ATP-binding protein n=1 Tax=Staphylococcus TaxID=1279 RepID=UPI0008A5687B|nr:MULTISPECIES: ABC transporter ATP-binding protein [Staphylococcus]ARB78649.1 ABC transporter ATP-binding protein [Staphylococcus lugdunensis]ARJ17453.1 multidrug ABC transporter permease [Staphylococcus lugdunensis]MBM7134363.1 ABC transporter ATP-binding protein [Staphylococcus lugdunensis]MCH8641851.1 ABC transporter ATP-binding protein/permease [Staphylococcus lugdunensis]MCH8643968.1 ABC transporter ATP-binding protein/permease [Staphylococcus lugdunensis]